MPTPSAADPLAAALARVGDRWSLLVIDALLTGPLRFNQLQAAVAGVASNVLTQRLKHLEAEGIVVARPYQSRPVRFSYELTAVGEGLAGALRLLAQWGVDHGDATVGAEHAACGTALEARWYCPTCEITVDGDETLSGRLSYL